MRGGRTKPPNFELCFRNHCSRRIGDGWHQGGRKSRATFFSGSQTILAANKQPESLPCVEGQVIKVILVFNPLP
ncbi:hypothetical protein GQ55_4G269100 [Panicum hallii var. hallii]|uniref:Uncharacterized protein n=1 Tax=Panicum hallii var. hallii TaxID=1504633 RepID=A0A2T7E0J3_9POAL|nr:hypothetical protein GQ55_4G269100 [Panicum hallii var. hallii]